MPALTTRRALVGGAAIALVAVGLTAAQGARQEPPTRITACVADREHAPMLSTRDGRCPAGTSATSWDRYGQGAARGARGATGPQGPSGAQGPAGAQGARGPAGADGSSGPVGAPGLSGLESVTANVDLYSVSPNPSSAAQAACPAGKSVISGGYAMANAGGSSAWVSSVKMSTSQPYSASGIEGWEVRVTNNSGFVVGVNVTVTAICAMTTAP